MTPTSTAVPEKAAGKPAAVKRVTIRDVASLAGLDIATVSRALNGKGYMAEATRNAALEAAERLGYEANRSAQSLRAGQQSRVVALYTSSLDMGVGTLKAQALQGQLQGMGYEVPIYATLVNSPTNDKAGAAQLRVIRRQRPQAIVYGGHATEQHETFAELKRYQDEGGHVVTYDFMRSGIDCDRVLIDRVDNTYRAAMYLLDLGHRRIAIAGAALTLPHPGALGFLRAMTEAGAPTDAGWLLDLQTHTYEMAGVELAERFLAMRERPTGIHVINDLAAAAFVHRLLRAGVRIPQDLSVIASDNLAQSEFGMIALTTTVHPIQEIAQNLAQLLDSRLTGAYQGPSREIIVKGGLVVRESTAPPLKTPKPEHS